MKLIHLVVLLLTICVSCGVGETIPTGLYVSQNNINTIDTVWVMEDMNYVNVMYRKEDRTLVYRNTGNWNYEGGYITFEDFFADEDQIHSHSEGAFEDVLMTVKLPLERKNGKVIIHHKPMYDNIYLQKVE